MLEIDCLGEVCPASAMKLKKALKEHPLEDNFFLVTDHSCACLNVSEICKAKGYSVKIEEPISGVWEISISKGDNELPDTL